MTGMGRDLGQGLGMIGRRARVFGRELLGGVGGCEIRQCCSLRSVNCKNLGCVVVGVQDQGRTRRLTFLCVTYVVSAPISRYRPLSLV